MRDSEGITIDPIIKLKKGTQIVYVPSHVDSSEVGNRFSEHYKPDEYQPGFVTSGPTGEGQSARGICYFCRYWRYDYKAHCYVPELRTASNSELTPTDCIVVMDFMNQYHIDAIVQKLDL